MIRPGWLTGGTALVSLMAGATFVSGSPAHPAPLAYTAAALPVAVPARTSATAVSVFVDGTNGTMTTGCATPGAGACRTIAQGLTAAAALAGDDVTVSVAAGTYTENDTLDGTGLNSLTLIAPPARRAPPSRPRRQTPS